MKIVDNYTEEEIIVTPMKVSWTPYQLYQSFPHAASAAKRQRRALIDDVFLLQDMPRASYPKDASFEFKVNHVNIDGPIYDKMQWVAFLDKYIALCRPKVHMPNDITGADIARAKSVPMTQFLEVNGAGFAACLKHNDKTPSVKYYPKDNKAHCFSCNWHFDVIDLIQHIHSCSFIEGVKRLGL